MRIQEHLFQGFFGLKKKKDALKYFKEKESQLTHMDEQLDEAIEAFQKKLGNHRKKMQAYRTFYARNDAESFKALRQEIEKLRGAFDEDERASVLERKKAEQIKSTLKSIQKDEEDIELKGVEREMTDQLNEIEQILSEEEQIWEDQLTLIETITNNYTEQTFQKKLETIFIQEDERFKREEHLLKETDLKLGILLRKTTLKLHDLEKVKDMDMQYREIKHIR